MSLKATLNGPNRRKQKVLAQPRGEDEDKDHPILFQIKDTETLFFEKGSLNEFGDCCFFDPNGIAGKALLQQHEKISGMWLCSTFFLVSHLIFSSFLHCHIYVKEIQAVETLTVMIQFLFIFMMFQFSFFEPYLFHLM